MDDRTVIRDPAIGRQIAFAPVASAAAIAVGTVAVGVLAVGRAVVRQVAISNGTIARLVIDDLEGRRLHLREPLTDREV